MTDANQAAEAYARELTKDRTWFDGHDERIALGAFRAGAAWRDANPSAEVLGILKRIAAYGPTQGEQHPGIACAFCDMGAAGYAARGDGFHDDECAVKDAEVLLASFKARGDG